MNLSNTWCFLYLVSLANKNYLRWSAISYIFFLRAADLPVVMISKSINPELGSVADDSVAFSMSVTAYYTSIYET